MASSLVDGYGSHKCMQVRRVTGSGSTTPGAESRKAAQAAFVVSGTRANRLCVAIARHGLLNALAQRHHLGCVLGQAPVVVRPRHPGRHLRSEEHTSELQSLMRISYAVFCLKKTKSTNTSGRRTHSQPQQKT